jgi:2-oxopent-4-enoate/cis-2-oxohex-4-enoate hydratase
MAEQELVTKLADELHEALINRATIPLLSARYPEFSVEDAYKVSLGVLNKRLASGEKLTGKKIGLTAKAVQDMLGIDEPDFGFLTDAMEVPNGGIVTIADHMITPMVEAEIALVLKASLPTKGVTPEMVLDATDYVTACFELVDTRFDTSKIKIVDTVADNASSALYVLGDKKVDPRKVDLAKVNCVVRRNGEQILSGVGAAVMGSP